MLVLIVRLCCGEDLKIGLYFNNFSQKASLLELKALLDEEREQRKEEREKAALDLKASIQRVQAEAQEEIKRHSDAALRREKEQQEMIYKLQVEMNQLVMVSCLFYETMMMNH